jgi:YesN/AraC family two-component response regulator
MFYDKIIVIDDDQRVINSLKLIFKKEYELICFTNGEEGLQYLSSANSIVLVLLDVMLNDLDGIVILEEIRKTNKAIPVMIMTAFASKDVAIRALQRGATDFIEKPFNLKELKDKIHALINQSPRVFAHHKQAPLRMKDFIRHNLANVSLKDVAQDVCLSEKYVSRLFKQKNNCGFREYKINARIARAKELLLKTSRPIQLISQELGYQNPETFVRIFKRRTSKTPTEYRADPSSELKQQI